MPEQAAVPAQAALPEHAAAPAQAALPEHAAVPDEARPAVPPGGTPEAADTDTDTDAPVARPSQAVRRTIVIACAGTVVIAVGVTSQLVSSHATKHKPAATSAQPTPTPVAVTGASFDETKAWIEANLERGTELTAQAKIAATLAADGYQAHAFTTASRWSTDGFVVATPAIRQVVARSLAAAAAHTASFPVAVFGTAPQQIEVRMIVAGSDARLQARLARDLADRVEAGRDLVANRHVTAEGRSHALLRAGRIDLRATTVLAMLAAKTIIRINAVALDPAEAAAGRPVRTLTVSVRYQSVLDDVLRTLTPEYAPIQVTPVGATTSQLVWGVGLAPDHPVN